MAKSRICSVDGCGNPYVAKGLCNKHYLRRRIHGSEHAIVRQKAKDGEALRYLKTLLSAEYRDECMTWPYAKSGGGYAQIWIEGKCEYVHRVICLEAHGPAPTPEHMALHSCGKGHLACCNYAHIYWGTRLQNKADEVTHGVINRGERQGFAKLTEQQVIEIRRLTDHMIQKDIAAKFGVSASAIRKIQKGKNWAWLSE